MDIVNAKSFFAFTTQKEAMDQLIRTTLSTCANLTMEMEKGNKTWTRMLNGNFDDKIFLKFQKL